MPLERALAFLSRHRVTVERVMTDNGPAYRSRDFAKLLAQAGLRHIRARPYTRLPAARACPDPIGGGHFIQSSPRAWAYARPFESSADRTAALDGCIGYYNYCRPHTALGGQPLARPK